MDINNIVSLLQCLEEKKLKYDDFDLEKIEKKVLTYDVQIYLTNGKIHKINLVSIYDCISLSPSEIFKILKHLKDGSIKGQYPELFL